MAKFLKGNELNAELEKVFETAQDEIILISPYIKLHDRYKSSLLTKLKQDTVRIKVLFGKNEDDFSKSMRQEDFDFFKQFPNIEILFESRLHAKYYANESKSILTSMNLYSFSQNNNIEAGVLMTNSLTLKNTLTRDNDLSDDSYEYFETVIEQAELLFQKHPRYEKKNIISTKKYIGSEVLVDKLSDFFSNSFNDKTAQKKPYNNHKYSFSGNAFEDKIGFCIRTGKKITFNIEKPMHNDAYKMWNKYKNPDFPEKYCHFSGEASNGETSLGKPILGKNWKKAKQKFNF